MAVNKQLAHEILTDILSYLPIPDLLSTSTVSLRMCTISQSLLYKAPTLINNVDWAMPSSLLLLLRILLSPGGEKLATYVRSLHVKWDDCARPESRFQLSLDSPSAAALLVDAGTRLGLDQSLTSQMGQLVLLLHLLPRLTVLDIAPPGGADRVFSEFLQAHSGALSTETLPLGLRQLREFRFSSDCQMGSVSPRALLTILNLPCIRRVDIRIDNSCFPFLAAEAAAATSTVTHLRLFAMSLQMPALGYILKIPTALTHFSYCTCTPDHDRYIMQALLPLQVSLQHLHIEWVGVQHPIGSLRSWPALRTVSCSLAALLGRDHNQDSPRLTDVLPASLRDLVIMREYYSDEKAVADQLVELVRQKKVIVPRLETLVVPLSDPQMWPDGYVIHTLRDSCEDAAVELVDTKSPAWESSFSQFAPSSR